MSTSILAEHYLELPELTISDDMEMWAGKMQNAVREFVQKVSERYNEGTLLRMLESNSVLDRRAAVLSLKVIGTFESNAPMVRMLHDSDEIVATLASDALWEIWFRGGTPEENRQLLQVLQLSEPQHILYGLKKLIEQAPRFAELYNQRAVIYYQLGEFQRAIQECEKVLELNPFHFGAQSGMGQCYLKINKPHLAVRCFKLAIEINPTLNDLKESIQTIERALDESDELG